MAFFVSKEMQDRFDDQGFVHIPAFISKSQVETILGYIRDKAVRVDVPDMYSNLEDLDRDSAFEIEKLLCDNFRTGIDRNFRNYRIAGSSFLFKGTGKHSESRLHQDWNIVDETKYRSMVIWVALEKVDQVNGCLVAVPGSHNWPPSIRSSNTGSLHLKFNKRLDRHIVSLPVESGDAVIYALNTFHGSKPNRSASTRKSAVVSITESDAVPVHYFRDTEKDRMYVVKADNAFMYDMYFRLSRGEKVTLDQLEVLEEVREYHRYLFTEADFFRLVDDKPGLLYRLRKLLSPANSYI